MRVLVFTAAYPSVAAPTSGTFVQEQVESLRKAGIDVDVFAFEGNRSAKNYEQAVKKLRRIVRQQRYDLVHAHYGLTGAAALLQREIPVVITYHGSDLLGEVGKDNRYTVAGRWKTVLSQGAGWGAVQRIVVAGILKPKLWPLPSVVIPMGVDISLFRAIPAGQARSQLGLPQKNRLILFPAAPENTTKRYDIACSAVDLLRRTYPDVALVPLTNVPHHRVPLYMNACDALILTSMHEASPCVIKEALACGLPIVSVNVGDVVERIAGLPGCYICDRNPTDAAEKLQQALEFGCRTDGRSRAAVVSLENVAEQVITVYEKAIHGTRN